MIQRNNVAIDSLRFFQDRRMLRLLWLLIALECIAAIWLSQPWAIGDSFHYLALAESIAGGEYGTLTQAGFEPDVLRPPGYPLLLWAFLYELRFPPVTVIILQMVAYCGALYAAQRYLIRREINAVPFVLIAALYPFPLLYSARLLAEPWVMLLTTAAALLVVNNKLSNYALAGGLAGVAALFRSDLLLLPLLFAALILTRQARQQGWIPAFAMSLLPLVAAAAVMLPYATWNYDKFNRFSPLPLAGAVGSSLYLSTWQDRLDEYDVDELINGRVTLHVKELGLPQAFEQINRRVGVPGNGIAFDPYNYPTVKKRIAAARVFREAAIARIAANPRAYATHVARNIWALWVTKRYPHDVPALGVAMLTLSSWAIFLLGFVGMAVAIFRPNGWLLTWRIVPITLYPAAIHIWLHTEARYTAATRPLLMMFAAAFVVWVFGRWTASEATHLRRPT